MAEKKKQSRYARKMKLQNRGAFSITSPFYSTQLHRGYRPRGHESSWKHQRPLLRGQQLDELWVGRTA